MKTREQFIQHWHAELVGVALTGLVLAADEKPRGPLATGARALLLPEKIASLLDRMYLWLEADAQPLTPRSTPNGQERKPAADAPAQQRPGTARG